MAPWACRPLTTQYLPREDGPLPRLEQAQELSDVVAKIAAAEPITERDRAVLRAGGSFGGAKPKALIEIGGEQWVVKFFNNEAVDSPLIEHATMTLAAKAGIQVAQTQVLTLANALHAVAVRRFDRRGDKRIHGISAGTALRAAAAAGQEPEMGYPALALLLRRAGVAEGDANAQDAAELFRRMVFNILVDNTDDHEKNHSLLVVSPGITAASAWRRPTTCSRRTQGKAARSSSVATLGTMPRWRTRCLAASRSA